MRNPVLSWQKSDQLYFQEVQNLKLLVLILIKHNPGSHLVLYKVNFKRQGWLQNTPLLLPSLKPSACYHLHHIPVLFLSFFLSLFLFHLFRLLLLSACPNICVAQLCLSTVTQPINKLPYMLQSQTPNCQTLKGPRFIPLQKNREKRKGGKKREKGREASVWASSS